MKSTIKALRVDLKLYGLLKSDEGRSEFDRRRCLKGCVVVVEKDGEGDTYICVYIIQLDGYD